VSDDHEYESDHDSADQRIADDVSGHTDVIYSSDVGPLPAHGHGAYFTVSCHLHYTHGVQW